MKWWRRKRGRRKVGYPRTHFTVTGDALTPRAWVSAGTYAAVDECNAALRGVIDDHNAFSDVAGP